MNQSAETVAQLAHDARNVLAAMGLYCDLLAQPGVLNRRYAHYAGHLKVVVDSGISLVGRLAGPLSNHREAGPRHPGAAGAAIIGPTELPGSYEARRNGRIALSDLGSEIERRRGMFSVLLGPRIDLEVDCLPCSGRVRLDPVDLGRILVNLVRNAGEAMPRGGRVRITVQQGGGLNFLPEVEPGILPHVLHEIVPTLTYLGADAPLGGDSPVGNTVLLCVEDNGPGVDPKILGQIFDSGFSTKQHVDAGEVNTARDTAKMNAANLNAGGTRNGTDDPSEPNPARSNERKAEKVSSTAKIGLGFGPPPASRGLGLGIVRSLVEAAGGQIGVVSRPGTGTRFEIEFPLLRADLAAGSQLKAGTEVSPTHRAEPAPETSADDPNMRVNAGTRAPRTVPEARGASSQAAPLAPNSSEGNEQEGSRVQC